MSGKITLHARGGAVTDVRMRYIYPREPLGAICRHKSRSNQKAAVLLMSPKGGRRVTRCDLIRNELHDMIYKIIDLM